MSKPTADTRLRILLACFAALVACTQIGFFTAPTLVNDNPGLLLALSSRMRHLLFSSAAGLNPVAYALIGYLRLLAAGWVLYLLGYHYGDRGFGWLEAQAGANPPATLRWMQQAADRFGWLLLFIFPGSNIACALVGQRKIRARRFLIAISAGIVFRLVWIRIAAWQFEAELKDALEWIEDNQWRLFAAFLVLSIVQSMRKSTRPTAQPRASADDADDAP